MSTIFYIKWNFLIPKIHVYNFLYKMKFFNPQNTCLQFLYKIEFTQLYLVDKLILALLFKNY